MLDCGSSGFLLWMAILLNLEMDWLTRISEVLCVTLGERGKSLRCEVGFSFT